jgi:hypothetical protein
MLRRRTRHRLRTASRLATAWLLFVVYTGAALGVPLPVPTLNDPAATPYPCQANRCGCRTAEQCWKSCCCNTNREKLAWAVVHGVTPPSYVAAAAEREAPNSKTRSCCSHKHAERTASPAATPARTADAASPPGIIWVSSLDAGRCGGSAPVWNNVPISLPAGGISSAPSFEPCVRPLATLAAAEPFCPWFAPPDPPPWIG